MLCCCLGNIAGFNGRGGKAEHYVVGVVLVFDLISRPNMP